ncbi:hypothetical protein AGMMS49546_29800 [Spirochaetia bacterium]|nr:hypothetical protein AGMMS49546_29800 [Spirochaetia bacterium]
MSMASVVQSLLFIDSCGTFSLAATETEFFTLGKSRNIKINTAVIKKDIKRNERRHDPMVGGVNVVNSIPIIRELVPKAISRIPETKAEFSENNPGMVLMTVLYVKPEAMPQSIPYPI